MADDLKISLDSKELVDAVERANRSLDVLMRNVDRLSKSGDSLKQLDDDFKKLKQAPDLAIKTLTYGAQRLRLELEQLQRQQKSTMATMARTDLKPETYSKVSQKLIDINNDIVRTITMSKGAVSGVSHILRSHAEDMAAVAIKTETATKRMARSAGSVAEASLNARKVEQAKWQTWYDQQVNQGSKVKPDVLSRLKTGGVTLAPSDRLRLDEINKEKAFQTAVSQVTIKGAEARHKTLLASLKTQSGLMWAAKEAEQRKLLDIEKARGQERLAQQKQTTDAILANAKRESRIRDQLAKIDQLSAQGRLKPDIDLGLMERAATPTIAKVNLPKPKDVDDLSKSFKQLALNGNDVHSMARGLASGFNLLWLTWGNLAPLMAGAALSFGAVSSFKLGAAFEQSMFEIVNLAGMASGEAEKLKAEMFELAATSTYTANEAAKAAKVLALAGLKGAEVSAALRPTLQFSSAGGVTLEKAAEVLTSVGTAYGFSAKQYSTVADIITKASSDSLASVEDMGEAFKSSSVLAQTYGVSLTDTAMALEMLANIGIKGSAAGTSARNFYTEIAKEDGKVGKMLKTLGVQAITAEGAAKPLLILLRDLAAATVNLTGKEQARVSAALSNERGQKLLAAGQARFTAELEKQRIEQSRSGPALLDQAASMESLGKKSEAAALRVRAVEAAYVGLRQETERATAEAAGISFFADLERQMTSMGTYEGVIASLQRSLLGAFDAARPALLQLGMSLRETFNSQAFRDDVTSLVTTVADLGKGLVELTKFLYEHKIAVAAVVAAYVGFGPLTALAGIVAGAAVSFGSLSVGALGAAAGLTAASAAFGPLAAAGSAAAASMSTAASSVLAVATGAASALAPTLLFTSAVWALRAALVAVPVVAAFAGAFALASAFADKGTENLKKEIKNSEERAKLLEQQKTMASEAVESEIANLIEAQKARNLNLTDTQKTTRSLTAAAYTRIDSYYTEMEKLIALQRELAIVNELRQEGATPYSAFEVGETYNKRIKELAGLRAVEKYTTGERIQNMVNLKQAEQIYALRDSDAARKKLQGRAEGATSGTGTGTTAAAADALNNDLRYNQLAEIEKANNAQLDGLRNRLASEAAMLKDFRDANLVEEGAYQSRVTSITMEGEKAQRTSLLSGWKGYEDEIARLLVGLEAMPKSKISDSDKANRRQELYAKLRAYAEKANDDLAKIEEDGAQRERRLYVDQYKELARLRKSNESSIASSQDRVSALLEESAMADATMGLGGAQLEATKARLKIELDAKKTLREFDSTTAELRAAQARLVADAEMASDDEVWEAKHRLALQLDAQIKALALGRAAFEVQTQTEVVTTVADVHRKADRARTEALASDVTSAIESALFDGGDAGSRKLRDVLEAELRKPITLAINAFVTPLISSVMGSFGIGGAGGAGGGATGVFGTLKGMYDMVTGGPAAFASSAFNQFATSSVGGAMGLSTPLTYTTGSGTTGGLTSTGSSLSGFASTAGNALAGYGLYKGLSGGYSIGKTLDKLGAVASLFGPVYGAIGGLVNRSFGRKLKDTGIQGSFGGAEGFTGENYEFYKGGWLRSDKTKTSAMDSEMQTALGSQFKTLKGSVAGMASALGMNADAITGYTADIKVSLKGLSEEQVGQKLAEEFTKMGEGMAALLPGINIYRKAGESASEALTRLYGYYVNEKQAEIAILNAQGKRIEALSVQRTLELALLDDVEKASKKRIYALEDEVTAATEAAGLQQQVNELTLTAAQLRAKEREALVPANQALFDHVTALQKVASAKDVLVSALDDLVSKLASTVEDFKNLGESLTAYRTSLSSGPAAQLSPQDAYNSTRAAFVANQALALTGDKAALGKVEGLGDAFLEASKSFFASNPNYFADLDLVKSGTDAAIAAALAQETAATQAKTDAEKQLEALGQVKTAVDSVEDATRAVQAAILQMSQATAIETYSKLRASGASVTDAYTQSAYPIASSSMTAAEKASTSEALRAAAYTDVSSKADAAVSLAELDSVGAAHYSGWLAGKPVEQYETILTEWKNYVASKFLDKFYSSMSAIDNLRWSMGEPALQRDYNGLTVYSSQGYSSTGQEWITKAQLDSDLMSWETKKASALANYESLSALKFAKGGAFTNGIVTEPTMFNMGQMGEAGPEAIMPLTRMADGSLGVAYSGQQANEELVAELRALRVQVERLEQSAAANVRVAQAVGKAQIEQLEAIADATVETAQTNKLAELAR